VSLRDLIVKGWALLWERLVSYIPLPRGLADLAVALIIVTVLVAIYRLHRGLFRAILVLLWGVLIASVIFYLVGD
jgi:xanthine/uracil permease